MQPRITFWIAVATFAMLVCPSGLRSQVVFSYDTSGNLTSVVASASMSTPTVSTVSQLLSVGDALSLTATLGGGGPVSYQWRLNGADIAGATNATYYVATAAATNAGAYSIVISNASSVVTNQADTVTVVASLATLHGIAYGTGRYVAVGENGTIVTSTDLVAWTTVSSGVTNHLEAASFANNLFVAVGSAGAVLTSTDGTNWAAQTSGNTNDLRGVAYGASVFLAVGAKGTTLTSTDGTNWTTQTYDFTDLEAVVWGSTNFVAVGKSGLIWTSTNGANWMNRSVATNANLYAVTYGGGAFVVAGSSGLILTSTDSVTWTAREAGTTATFEAVAYLQNTFIVLGPVGVAYLSSDGVNWGRSTSGTFDVLRTALVQGDQLVAAGNNGIVLPVPFAVVDHFEWSAIASPQRAGQSFSATITAKDAAGITVTNVSGTLTLSASSTTDASDTLLGSATSTNYLSNDGALTVGYVFTPSRDLLVTHFRHYSGTNVSVWGEDHALLASIDVTNAPGSWSESFLNVPLRLTGGKSYFLSATGTNVYFREDGLPTFDDGTIEQGLWAVGSAFPGAPSDAEWALVDIRYQVERPSSATATPASLSLVDGVASITTAISYAGTNVTLIATDSTGRTGTSNPFQVLDAGDLAIRVAASPDPASTLADLTYTLTVMNAGPGDSTGVWVTNTLPANCNLVSASSSHGSCWTNGTTVVGNVGTLAGQTNATITIVVRPTTPGVMLTNAAMVVCNESESNTANNSATTITHVAPNLTFSGSYPGIVYEGNIGYATNLIAVVLSQASPLAVSFDYTTASGTATANSDFVSTSGRATIPPGYLGVTIPVLVNGDTAIESDEYFTLNLSNPANAAIETSQKTMWILNDDGITGNVDHFDWNSIVSPQRIGAAFSATVTARDAAGNTATNFNQTGYFTGVNFGNGTNRVLYSDQHTTVENVGNYTFGYEFKPTSNLIITHFRHYSGTKVSLWTAGGSLLATKAVASTPGQWTETPLDTPVLLTANQSYLVGFYTGGELAFGRVEPPVPFEHGVITNRYYSIGDTFPETHDASAWRMVDLRYVLAAGVTPASGTFTNGIWSGNITWPETGTNAMILADDLNGHRGWSSPFGVYATNDLAVTIEVSPLPAIVGSNLTYTVSLLNAGPDNATGVWATNVLPADATLVSVALSQGSCTTNGNLLTCDLGTLAGLTSATVTIVVTPTVAGAAITNAVTVVRNEADPNTGNNTATSIVWPSLDLTFALASAANLEGHPWKSGGPVLWWSQNSVAHDGVGSAQSGAITHNQTNWMETVVRGPGTLSFWWKVSSQSGADELRFRTNGVLHSAISGSVDWQQVLLSVPAHLFTNRWEYAKDSSISSGSDAGWVDQIEYTVPSFSLGSPTMPGNGQFQLTLVTTNGQQLVVQESDDLIFWTSLSTNTATGGTVSFTDTQATNYPIRFYRAIHRNAP